MAKRKDELTGIIAFGGRCVLIQTLLNAIT